MRRLDGQTVIRWSSRLTLTGALLLGAYVLVRFGIESYRLPVGVCPLTNLRPLAFIAAGLSLISLVLSFFVKDKKKTACDRAADNDKEVS